MKKLNKALIATAVLAGLGATNAFAGTEACVVVYKGSPTTQWNLDPYGRADCTVTSAQATAEGIIRTPGSVAYEVTRDTHINLQNNGFFGGATAAEQSQNGLQLFYVPTSDIPGGSRITMKLSGATFDVANQNQIFLVAPEGQVLNNPRVVVLATSDGALNNTDTVNFIVQSGVTIPAGTRLMISKERPQTTATVSAPTGVAPVSLRIKNSSCGTQANVALQVTSATSDARPNDQIEGALSATTTILNIEKQHKAFSGATPQNGIVDVLTRDFQDSRFYFVDHNSPIDYFRNNSTPYAHNGASGSEVFERTGGTADHFADYQDANGRSDYRVAIDDRQRYLDLISDASFDRKRMDIGVPLVQPTSSTNGHRVFTSLNTELHTSVGSTQWGIYRGYDDAAAPTAANRNYLTNPVTIRPGTSDLGLLNTEYNIPLTVYFTEAATVGSTSVNDVFITLTPDQTRTGDARRLGFNYSVNANARFVFDDNVPLQGQAFGYATDNDVKYVTGCTDSTMTHAVTTNGALLKAPYAVDGPGNFIRVTNEATHEAHVVAEIFGESANGTTGNRHVQDVYLGTVPAKSSVVFAVPDVVKAAVEQKGYTGSNGGYTANSQKGFLSTLTPAGVAKPVSSGYNQQAAANRHTITLTVTAEQNKAHAVTVQRIPGGVDRVMPIFKPTKELTFGQNGEPKLTFSWQQ